MLRTVCVRNSDGKPWDDNSIRSALYYDVANKGYGVTTNTISGEPHYVLWLPEGATEPLGSRPRKS